MQQQWTVFLFGLMNRYILHVSCKVGLVKNVNSRVLANSSALVFLLNYQKIVDVQGKGKSFLLCTQLIHGSLCQPKSVFVGNLIIIERIVLQFSHNCSSRPLCNCSNTARLGPNNSVHITSWSHCWWIWACWYDVVSFPRNFASEQFRAQEMNLVIIHIENCLIVISSILGLRLGIPHLPIQT